MQQGDGETGRQEASSFPCLWPNKFFTPKVDLLARRLKKIFESLPCVGYFGREELADYTYYEKLIIDALNAIDEKARAGLIRALDTREYPKILRYPEGVARIAVYIGSFDPFQLTHLTIALRLLASAQNNPDLVIVVPEGSVNPDKPSKTDYPFRYQIAKMQLAGLFEPFILPLDIGANADTIEIVRRLIAMHSGMRLELTHLIGSDALPLAAKYIDADLSVWRKQAAQSGVDYIHSVYVMRREQRGSLERDMRTIRSYGVDIHLERKVIGTPSSTEFRQNRAITLVLPTEAIRDKLEILFRYNMNKPWSS
jgi:nicotinic acid mononucleotide adenylyltransferase